ncbi:Bug family tripartite tricarboxylate transporter substrate binding protein [Enterovirga rhinocerotis]|uniref:Tripartite-type tricarboxylate transporter receptor subunit TctC n=1 Tax=Enterovirga rhinocerotis TaxID=1339210 RepID=A0A4R7BNQ3_9HYPH|nr:tripartite tricarboxylate transporter substrate binding protein [Enterovirga rhinocerotis]TDR87170.1 tripartite-type tricarboxylate transporter receptor subunit TctC [Enterovirga rhinocerotis]
MRLDRRSLLAGGAASIALGRPASAQGWPARPVTIIVPYTAGGTTDLFGRIFGQALQEKTGNPFIVENRAGAGGTVGAAFAAKAPPDGYTLFVGTVATQATAPYVFKKLAYDAEKDFAPISLFATLPNMLVVTPKMPVKTLADFVAHAKANDGKLSFGSSGAGSSNHLTAELLAKLTGVRLVHVPYRSSGDIMNALAGGHVDLAFDNITLAWPQAQGGKVTALAVTTKDRSPTAPDVPAMAETFPGFDIGSWHGLYAPAGTPKEIVDRLAADVRQVFSSESVKKRLFDIGAVARPMSPADFAAFGKAERAKYQDLIRQIGLEPV